MIAALVAFAEMNLAAATAIIGVLTMRRHVHRLMGPGAAYLLWAVVPAAMVATLIPARTIVVSVPVASLSGLPWSDAISPLAAGILGMIWAAGALATIAVMVLRQYLFLRDASLGLAGPAVIGFLKPRIVTPGDFTTRFSAIEQKLILEHEQVHLERHDARINAAVALARCVMWFNPLVHLGAKALRADQEASCDAAVIENRPRARRVYAETLLKTQMETRPLPVGCYWPAEDVHPLTERIGMLTRAPFSHRRRLAAAGAVLALVGGGGVTAWAAQPARQVLAEAKAAEVVWVSPLLGGPELLVQINAISPGPPPDPGAPPGQ